MNKATSRSNGHLNYHAKDLERDYKKLKSALADTRKDVANKVEKIVFDSIESAKEKSADMQNTVADYVAEKPFKSLGIIALTGFIIGYLLRK